MANYLVTGGAGFIGSHLAAFLIEMGHGVRILDNLSTGLVSNIPHGAEFFRGDIRNAGEVRAAIEGVDGVFHLAAVASVQASTEDWLGAHSTNLSGAVVVFDAARAHANGPLPVVYASSAAVYGDNDNTPLSESESPRPQTAYGADKYGCELHARAGAGVHGLASVGMRFFNVYGPRQDPRSPYSGVISIFAERMLRGEDVSIFGDGAQSRDFVFVGDVCRALDAAMRHIQPGADVVNVCTGRETTVRALADEIAQLSQSRSAVTHKPPRAGDIRRSLGDPTRLASRYGVLPATPLHDGLSLTLNWLAEQKDRAHAA